MFLLKTFTTHTLEMGTGQQTPHHRLFHCQDVTNADEKILSSSGSGIKINSVQMHYNRYSKLYLVETPKYHVKYTHQTSDKHEANTVSSAKIVQIQSRSFLSPFLSFTLEAARFNSCYIFEQYRSVSS